MLRSVNKIRIYDRKEKTQCFFWNTFGCASLAASKRHPWSAKTRASHSKHQAKRPRTNDGASPELGLLVVKSKNQTPFRRKGVGAFFCLFDTENSMHGDGPRKASPMRHLRSKIR